MKKKDDKRRLSLCLDVNNVVVTERFHEAFEYLADEVGIPSSHIIEVIVAPSDRMRELKFEHFGVDSDTDVIAFPTDIPDLPPEVKALAGELFLGATMIAANAQSEGWSFSEEFCFVLAHGLLHLKGWSDGTAADRRAMFEEQERLLRLLRGKDFDLTSLVRLRERPDNRELMVW